MKTTAPKAGKVCLHNRIAQVMLDGEPKSPAQLIEIFKNVPEVAKFLPARLSCIFWQLRAFDQAVIKVTKNGKRVTGYAIVNYKEFDSNGIGPARQVKSQPVAKVVETVTSEPTETQSEKASESVQ